MTDDILKSVNQKQLIVPVFQSKPTILFRILSLLFVTASAGLFINIFFFDIKWINFVFILLLVLLSILMGIVKNDQHTDDLILTVNAITIVGKVQFLIHEMKDLVVKIGGYEGKKGLENIRSCYSDDGKNNFIEFNYRNSPVKFRILISSKNYGAFMDLVNVWKNK